MDPKAAPHIVVAVPTCRRPRMLGQLLDSFATLASPPATRVSFLVVDNAPDAPAREVVDDVRRRTGIDISYVVEHEPGIPFARNRALDEAVAAGADFLAFVDDDEYVDREWLIRLFAHQQRERSHLVGGPVRLAPHEPRGFLDRLIERGVRRRYERKEEKNARRRQAGEDDTVTIITNNWLADLDWMRRAGLRFDISLRYSGGSDTALYHKAKSLGASTSWCPDAVVYERIPPERMSLAYQFRRARDQAATSFWRKGVEERRSVPVNIATAGGKVIAGGVLVLLSPLTAGRTLVDGVRLVGYGIGYANAMAGRRSRHYEVLQGE
ncbi:MAG TPA: glycosyltransferase family A protein [Bauldia sp.]|nr:glycosyltransferase family A protein [Bauldia sp.]